MLEEIQRTSVQDCVMNMKKDIYYFLSIIIFIVLVIYIIVSRFINIPMTFVPIILGVITFIALILKNITKQKHE